MTNLFVSKPRRRADRVAHRKLAIVFPVSGISETIQSIDLLIPTLTSLDLLRPT